MSVVWEGLFIFLAIEVLAVLALSLPIPAKWRVKTTNFIMNNRFTPHVAFLVKIVVGVCAIMLFDAIRTQARFQVVKQDNALNTIGHFDARVKMLYAQRNIYISGGAILLVLILGRYYKALCDLTALQERIEVLESNGKAGPASGPKDAEAKKSD